MQFNLKKYFVSTSTERKGMFVLVLLLILIISFYWVDDYFFDSTPTNVMIEEVEVSKEILNKSKRYKQQLSKNKIVLFQFNPN